MANVARKVVIKTHNVGSCFGTVGAIYDAVDGRKLTETDKVYPYTFHAAARRGAESVASKMGWTVVEVQS